MAFVSVSIASIDNIPDLNHVIIASGGNVIAIRRPRHTRYSNSVACVSVEIASIDSIPDPYRVIIAPGGDARAIRRPCHAVHGLGMACVGVFQLPWRWGDNRSRTCCKRWVD